tara:strand:- start:195 stop:419 length:225 start_codon:yes stop_codon:yes gene_type:complete
MKKLMSIQLLLISFNAVIGQNVGHLDGLSGLLRTNDKFYVVISVIVTIFVGFFLYLIFIDRKLKKMERDFSENK